MVFLAKGELWEIKLVWMGDKLSEGMFGLSFGWDFEV